MLDLEFSTVDYAVFGSMLAVSFVIGLYHAFKSSGDNEAYLMGGHSIGIIPMAISLCASFNSAYMILGIPSEIYSYGSQFYVMIFGTGLGVLIAGELWIPVLYRLQVVSMYAYFEGRYKSKFPRILMTMIFILKTMLYVAIVLYAPTIALSSVTSLSWWVCILILGVSSTLYTTLGGMKAIVWTDVFQIFIMFGGMIAILVQGLSVTGGFDRVWQTAKDGGRIEFFNLSADPFTRHTLWNVFFGTVILWGAPYTCSQYLVHRCICLESEGKAKIALYVNYVGQITMVTMVGVIGLIMFSYYHDCDPVLAKVVAKRDAVIPLFVLQELGYYGIPGLFISCLFSGALSTLDSALHSLAAVTWEEVKHLKYFKGVSAQTETRITKGLSVAFGIAATGLAFLCNNLGSLISAGGVLFGACMGPMFAFCLISILCPAVNLRGASVGLIGGQLINIWLSIGAMFYGPKPVKLPLSTEDCSMFNITSPAVEIAANSTSDPILTHTFIDVYRMSYNIYPLIGFVCTAVLSIVVSVLTGGGKDLKDEDKKYFHPMAWRMYGRRNGAVNEKIDLKSL